MKLTSKSIAADIDFVLKKWMKEIEDIDGAREETKRGNLRHFCPAVGKLTEVCCVSLKSDLRAPEALEGKVLEKPGAF